MDISHPCCERNCLQDLTFEFISETRTEFWKLVICDQNSLVCNHRATVLPEERCVLAGCLVCSECWRVVHGISKSRYDNCNLLSEAYEFHLLIFTSEVILGSYRYIQCFHNKYCSKKCLFYMLAISLRYWGTTCTRYCSDIYIYNIIGFISNIPTFSQRFPPPMILFRSLMTILAACTGSCTFSNFFCYLWEGLMVMAMFRQYLSFLEEFFIKS